MTWWLWMVLGCGLLIMEMLTPGGFFFLFFGFGAIITGILAMVAVIDDWLQIGLFTVISVVFLIFFRKKVKAMLEKSDSSGKDIDGLVGLIGTAVGGIAPDDNGNVEVRGANWSAKNIGAAPLATGDRCKVQSVHGLTLHVKAE